MLIWVGEIGRPPRRLLVSKRSSLGAIQILLGIPGDEVCHWETREGYVPADASVTLHQISMCLAHEQSNFANVPECAIRLDRRAPTAAKGSSPDFPVKELPRPASHLPLVSPHLETQRQHDQSSDIGMSRSANSRHLAILGLQAPPAPISGKSSRNLLASQVDLDPGEIRASVHSSPRRSAFLGCLKPDERSGLVPPGSESETVRPKLTFKGLIKRRSIDGPSPTIVACRLQSWFSSSMLSEMPDMMQSPARLSSVSDRDLSNGRHKVSDNEFQRQTAPSQPSVLDRQQSGISLAPQRDPSTTEQSGGNTLPADKSFLLSGLSRGTSKPQGLDRMAQVRRRASFSFRSPKDAGLMKSTTAVKTTATLAAIKTVAATHATTATGPRWQQRMNPGPLAWEMQLLSDGSHIAVVDPRPAMREAVAAALARRLSRTGVPTDDWCGKGELHIASFRVLHLRFDKQSFAAGLDGFWQWVLGSFHAAAPDLFPLQGVLASGHSSFRDAFSLDRIPAAPPTILICSETCLLASAPLWFASSFLQELRGLGKDPRSFMHSVAMVGGEALSSVDMQAYTCDSLPSDTIQKDAQTSEKQHGQIPVGQQSGNMEALMTPHQAGSRGSIVRKHSVPVSSAAYSEAATQPDLLAAAGCALPHLAPLAAIPNSIMLAGNRLGSPTAQSATHDPALEKSLPPGIAKVLPGGGRKEGIADMAVWPNLAVLSPFGTAGVIDSVYVRPSSRSSTHSAEQPAMVMLDGRPADAQRGRSPHAKVPPVNMDRALSAPSETAAKALVGLLQHPPPAAPGIATSSEAMQSLGLGHDPNPGGANMVWNAVMRKAARKLRDGSVATTSVTNWRGVTSKRHPSPEPRRVSHDSQQQLHESATPVLPCLPDRSEAFPRPEGGACPRAATSPTSKPPCNLPSTPRAHGDHPIIISSGRTGSSGRVTSPYPRQKSPSIGSQRYLATGSSTISKAAPASSETLLPRKQSAMQTWRKNHWRNL